MTDTTFNVRRVVLGTGADGRSGVVSDAPAECATETAAFRCIDLWNFQGLPTPRDSNDRLPESVEITPPNGMGTIRISRMLPDAAWAGENYLEQLAEVGLAEGAEPSDSILHETPTVDVNVVLSGEVYCVTETEEVLLRAGDSIVVPGVQHGWSVRGDEPAIIMFMMASAS